MADLLNTLKSAAKAIDVTSLANEAITYLKISSAYGPDLVIDRPLQPVPPEQRLTTRTEKFFRMMKPRFELGIAGSKPIILQPYGTPPPTQWGTVMVVSGLVGGLLVAFGLYGFFRVIKPQYGSRKALPGRTDGLAGARSRRSRRRK